MWNKVRKNVSVLGHSQPNTPALAAAAPATGATPATATIGTGGSGSGSGAGPQFPAMSSPPAPPPLSPLSPTSPTAGPSSPKIDRGDDDDMASLFMSRAGSVTMGADIFYATAAATTAEHSAARKRASALEYGAVASGTSTNNDSNNSNNNNNDGRGPAQTCKEAEKHQQVDAQHDQGAPAPPKNRWAKFAFLCSCMIFPVGGSGEGIQSFFDVVADHGVFGDLCEGGVAPCHASHLRMATLIVVALSVMNIAGVFSGIVVDAVGVRIAAVVSAVLWAAATGISGIAPGNGIAWAAGLVLQQCANGAIFLSIFTGLLRQLFPDDERLFAMAAAVCSGCWDLGAVSAYAYREVLGSATESFAANYAILGAAFGLVPAVVVHFAFEQPQHVLSMERLRGQLAAMRRILDKPFFWLCALLMWSVCQNGYSLISFIGEILHWKKATDDEIKTMRPWVANMIAASCVFAIIPGKLMSSPRLGIFGGVAVTCLLLSALAAAMLCSLVLGGVAAQFASMAIMATWRTMCFTLLNSVLPLWLIVCDEMDPQPDGTKLVSATGLAFGIMSLFGGLVSLGAGFLFGDIFKAHGSGAGGASTNATTNNVTDRIIWNATTAHPAAAADDAVAPGYVFVITMSVIWGLAVVIPLPMAVRCYFLQKQRDERHHALHKQHHHEHHADDSGVAPAAGAVN